MDVCLAVTGSLAAEAVLLCDCGCDVIVAAGPVAQAAALRQRGNTAFKNSAYLFAVGDAYMQGYQSVQAAASVLYCCTRSKNESIGRFGAQPAPCQASAVLFFQPASLSCLAGTMWAVNRIKQTVHCGVATLHTCGWCPAAVAIAHDVDSIEFPPCLHDTLLFPLPSPTPAHIHAHV